MYAESIRMALVAHKRGARRVEKKPLVYNMRPQGCQETDSLTPQPVNIPQLTDCKRVLEFRCLTLPKTGTYTGPMSDRRSTVLLSPLVALAIVLAAIASPPRLV